MSEFNNSFDWIQTHLDTKLQWMKRMCEFDRDHLAIMMKCSYKNRPWISYSELSKIGINEDDLKECLGYLLSIRVLLCKADQKTHSCFFGLRERFNVGG